MTTLVLLRPEGAMDVDESQQWTIYGRMADKPTNPLVMLHTSSQCNTVVAIVFTMACSCCRVVAERGEEVRNGILWERKGGRPFQSRKSRSGRSSISVPQKYTAIHTLYMMRAYTWQHNPLWCEKATYGLHLSNDQMWKGLSLFRGCINDAVAVFIHVRYLPLAELWWLPPPVMATEISSPLLPSSHVGQAAFWSSKTGVVHWNWCPPRLGLYCIFPRHTRQRIKCRQW